MLMEALTLVQCERPLSTGAIGAREHFQTENGATHHLGDGADRISLSAAKAEKLINITYYPS